MELPNFKTIKRLSLALQENCQLIEKKIQPTINNNLGSIHTKLTYGYLNESFTDSLSTNKFHPEADRVYQETMSQINLLCEILKIKNPGGSSNSQQWLHQVNNIALAGISIGNCEDGE